MKLISFNVNGIKAITQKDEKGMKKCPFSQSVLVKLIDEHQPDILCLQEIKASNDQNLICFKEKYENLYYNISKARKGYSGVAVMTKDKPISVWEDFKLVEEDLEVDISDEVFEDFEKMLMEGRILTLEFEKYFVVNVYTPNSGEGLKRLKTRIEWDEVFRNYISLLEEVKPVIICGDLNIAAQPIDIKNAGANTKSAGFTIQERISFQKLLDGRIDTFRYLHPEEVKYSYWSNFFKAREKNAGWRIDYIIISGNAKEFLVESDILTEVMGSDHAPVIGEFDF